MRECNSESRDLGGWIKCDATQCATRIHEYQGSGRYGWTTTKIEPCAGPVLPSSAAPPAELRTPLALVLFVFVAALSRYLARRDARELDARQREQRALLVDLRAETALARNRRFLDLLTSDPAAATKLAKARQQAKRNKGD